VLALLCEKRKKSNYQMGFCEFSQIDIEKETKIIKIGITFAA
jgi:hypothetical protein